MLRRSASSVSRVNWAGCRCSESVSQILVSETRGSRRGAGNRPTQHHLSEAAGISEIAVRWVDTPARWRRSDGPWQWDGADRHESRPVTVEVRSVSRSHVQPAAQDHIRSLSAWLLAISSALVEPVGAILSRESVLRRVRATSAPLGPSRSSSMRSNALVVSDRS